MRQLTFIDWFAGVGGFRRGMELAGHKCVGFCEYDKFATASYVSMHLLTDEQRERLGALDLKQRQKEILKEEYKNNEWYARDIRTVNVSDIPRADAWCFGFPCQDISVAGAQRGFEGNRSSLFFRVMYLVSQIRTEERPDYLFIENVRNLLSVNGGWDFARLLVELEKCGYDTEWQLLNSKDYGVPQNRERVFIIGHSRNGRTAPVFPISGSAQKNSVEIKQVGEAISDTRKNPNQYRAYEADGIAPALNSMGGGGREPHIITDVSVVGGMGKKKSNNGTQWFQQDRVYNGEGVATSVAANLPGGANMYAIPMFAIDKNVRGKESGETARCLTARYDNGVINHKGVSTAIAYPINTEDDGTSRTIKASAQRITAENYTCKGSYAQTGVMVEAEPIGGIYTNDAPDYHRGIKDGEARTLKGQNHDSGVALKIKEATKQGYAEAHEGDSINLTMPDSETRRGRVGLGVANTLDTQCNQGVPVIWYDKRKCYIAIRKLTPKECWRLQGWTDDYFERAQFVNSDSQLYKQAGNGVTVTVIQAIAERLGNDT